MLSRETVVLLVAIALTPALLQAETPPATVLPNTVLPNTAPPYTAPPYSEKRGLQKKTLGDMRPVHVLGDVYLTGQPTRQDLTLLKQAGIKTVITLRKSEEISWDEAAGVKKQGMQFVEAPFQSAEELRPQVFDKVLKVLRDKQRGPTVLHCGVANRVGAIWYAHRVLDGKLTPEAALTEARVVGLRTPAYLERAQAYVDDKSRESRDQSLEVRKP